MALIFWRKQCSVAIVCMALNAWGSEPTFFNVRQYGAKGDDSTKDTAALQRAIDACHQQGGGTVYIPPGVYISGSLHLAGNISLFLDHGATLKASADDKDFDPYEKLDFKNAADRETSFFHFALIWAEDRAHIAISGTGIIDGNRRKRGGPKPIALKRCQQVTIRDITINNAPNYAISLLGTDNVLIDGVRILNGYCDGIDPDGCRHVRIANCYIESRDDAIVPKTSFSLGYHRSTEYLTVSNCTLITECNGFKLGTESGGDFKHIAVSNCVLHRHPEWDPPSSGISLESVDGSRLEDIAISNFVMDDVSCPIFLRLGNRGRDQAQPTPGSVKNITLNAITASGARQACLITGIPGYAIENVMLSQLQLSFNGGGTLEQAANKTPENIAGYPDADNFGVLPAFGLYLRHARGVSVENVRFSLQAIDQRPAIYAEDVQDLDVHNVHSDWHTKSREVIQLVDVRQAWLSGVRTSHPPELFFNIEGKSCSEIIIDPTLYQKRAKIFSSAKNVDRKAVQLVGTKR